jgi:hypothetical protein
MVQKLVLAIDTPIQVLYLKLLSMIREHVLEQYRTQTSSTSSSTYKAMVIADAEFVRWQRQRDVMGLVLAVAVVVRRVGVVLLVVRSMIGTIVVNINIYNRPQPQPSQSDTTSNSRVSPTNTHPSWGPMALPMVSDREM